MGLLKKMSMARKSRKSRAGGSMRRKSPSKGMSGRRHQSRRQHHANKSRGRGGGARAGGRRSARQSGGRSGARQGGGRRLDSYHLRRRYLHGGMGAGTAAGAMAGMEDMFDEDGDCMEPGMDNLDMLIMERHEPRRMARRRHRRILGMREDSPTSSKSSEPSAPPLETIGEENIMPDNDFSFPDPPRECAVYQNGQIVRHITATKYNEFEVRGDIEEGCCFGQEVFPCPSDMLCPASRRALEVPASLSRRGLQIPREDFEEILAALSDASKVRLFSFTKNVSLPCLYLLAMIIVGGLSIALWFLSVFCIKKYQTREEARISIFWAFMVGILFVPALMALAGLGLMIRTANKMYKKFKHTQAEFNKRFRELNLILHSKKSYWFCSGRLKLFFIYYNFEQCQQMLYRHVCAGMTLNGHVNIEENTHLLHAEGADHYENGNTATVRIDRIMRRVNSLVNRYEWEYFEKLINKKLPSVDKFEHRKRGICFCQFAQLRAREDAAKAASINVRAARHATGRIVTRIPISARIRNWTRTLLRRTHRDEPSIVTTHIGNGTSARMNGNGRTRNGSAAYFSQSEPGEVVFI